jgi:hypothetical protein
VAAGALCADGFFRSSTQLLFGRGIHVRSPLEFEGVRRANPQQSGTQLDSAKSPGVDLLVKLLPAHEPVLGQFSDRDVWLCVRSEVLDRNAPGSRGFLTFRHCGTACKTWTVHVFLNSLDQALKNAEMGGFYRRQGAPQAEHFWRKTQRNMTLVYLTSFRSPSE